MTRISLHTVTDTVTESVTSSYYLQYALHMRSIMHCVCFAGVREYLKMLAVVIAKLRSYDKNRGKK